MSSMLNARRTLGSRVACGGSMAEEAMEYNGRVPRDRPDD